MQKDLTSVIVLLLVAAILLRGRAAGIDSYSAFLSGAEHGMKASVRLLPGLTAMMLMISALEASGALKYLIAILRPMMKCVNLPEEAMPVLLLRPLTGSGCIAALEQIYESCGPDSRASRVASVLMGSSETIFYTMTVYLGVAGIRKLPYVLSVSMLSYAAAAVVCGLIV